jgi:LSU ribosomal protein L20P
MRVKGPSSRKFKKKILKLAKGFRVKSTPATEGQKSMSLEPCSINTEIEDRKRESLEGSGSQGSTQGSDPTGSPTASS